MCKMAFFLINGILAILISRYCSIELRLINISEAKQCAYKMSDWPRLPRFEGWVPCQARDVLLPQSEDG